MTSSQETLCGCGNRNCAADRQQLMEYGRGVIEAHSDLCRSDIEEQLDAHFESQFPELNDFTLIADVIEDLMTEAFDPAPYCSYGHPTKASCDCGPIAENE